MSGGGREIVAVDIGGTHARFALAQLDGDDVVDLGEPSTYRVAEHAGLAGAWTAFGRELGRGLPAEAAIAAACPVDGDLLRLTNSSWIIRRSSLDRELGLERHLLINDFVAVGHAVAAAGAADLAHLCGPDDQLPQAGVVSVIGPGTGLGVAQLVRGLGTNQVLPSEGGHIGFAPGDAVDDLVLAKLRAMHGRVSVERVVSGPGLRAIYAAIVDREPALDDAMLWQSALDGLDGSATEALNHFCRCLGSVAGDLALAHGASGVVIAGGVGLRLAKRLPHSLFAGAFAGKGRFAARLSAIPVKILTHPQPGLLGAAAAFARAYHDD